MNMFKKLSWAVLGLSLFAAAPALADDMDVDLSAPDVRLDASFEGSDLILFGAKDMVGDIIVVVRGPSQAEMSMRKKERVMGVWVKGDEVIFKDVPRFYTIASTKPLDDLLPKSVLSANQIGIENLSFETVETDASVEDVQGFMDGLIRNMQATNLYSTEVGDVKTVGKQLFRTNLTFPANVAVGDYVVETYLIVDGKIESTKSTTIQVHKVGIEAEVYNFAHDYALWYGLLAIVIAVVSGWTANAIFRKG